MPVEGHIPDPYEGLDHRGFERRERALTDALAMYREQIEDLQARLEAAEAMITAQAEQALNPLSLQMFGLPVLIDSRVPAKSIGLFDKESVAWTCVHPFAEPDQAPTMDAVGQACHTMLQTFRQHGHAFDHWAVRDEG